jgi:MarR family transcriptional regulator, 2-MHQ and catechol-resistance regulon repressor
MAAETQKTEKHSVGPQAEAAFRTLLRTGGLVRGAMQPHFLRFGISGSQWGVLRALHRAEAEGIPCLRLTNLSQRLLVQPPSTTGVVGRLLRMGLVARCIARDDARARQVSLTQAGRELVERVLEGLPEQVQAVMAGLDARQLRQLQKLMDRLGAHLEGTALRVETT